jgi:mRNA interferase MazF
MVVSRFDIFLVNLDPTKGSEIKKTRPCVVISPDEMNMHLNTAIIVPMTTKRKIYPSRVEVTFDSKKGQIVLDQIRTIDRSRLVKKVGALPLPTAKKTVAVLLEMFRV